MRIKSGIKRKKQNIVRRDRNKSVRTRLRSLLKTVRAAAEAKDVDAARSGLLEATRALQKAASKGVIHRNAAARGVARLTARVNAASAPAADAG